MTRKARLLAACLLTAGTTGLHAGAPPLPDTQRAITLAAPGRVILTLDPDVYERARADLGDLRVVDDTGAAVPYLLQRAHENGESAPRYPRVLNRSFLRGRAATITLDFGATTLKSELALSLSGDNFRRRVTVEGRGRRDPAWVTLTDSAYVFAVPEPRAARYERVTLPENNFQHLRVTVHHGADDPERIEIVDVSAQPQRERRPREVPLSARMTRQEDAAAHETRFTLDLGARHQPFRALQVDARSPEFFRGVVIDARLEQGAGQAGQPLIWRYVGEGALYRYQEGGEGHEALRVDAVGRERVLRLTVKNRDDAPLDIASVIVMVPVERLAFEARPGRAYRLTYGTPTLGAPTYDLARTAGDPALWAARAEEARLEAPVRIAPAAATVPWTERHPALLWGGLVTVVALMGGVTWRALQAAS